MLVLFKNVITSIPFYTMYVPKRQFQQTLAASF